jgi:hypothetical protein
MRFIRFIRFIDFPACDRMNRPSERPECRYAGKGTPFDSGDFGKFGKRYHGKRMMHINLINLIIFDKRQKKSPLRGVGSRLTKTKITRLICLRRSAGGDSEKGAHDVSQATAIIH